jgi:hypothetical protein
MPVGPLLLWSTLGIALLHTGSRPVTTNDLHVFLAMGRWMTEHGRLLEEEVFTWTAAGTPFANATWGFSVLSWKLHEAIGLDGLRLLNGGLVAAALFCLARACLASGAQPRAAAMATLYAWALMLQNTVIRGQTWVFLCMAGVVWLVARERSPGKVAVAGVAIGCAWANLHGSFPAGIVLAGAIGAGKFLETRQLASARTPLIAAGALALGACIGPYGPGIWAFVQDNSALPRARDFVEWYPPDPRAFEGARFYSALALWIFLLGRRQTRTPIAHLLLLVGFGFLAVSGTRFIAWFGLATAAPLAIRLSETMAPEHGVPRRLGRVVTGVLGMLWLLFLGRGLAPTDTPLHWDTPVDLVAAIGENAATGRIFNPPEYGGYLALELGPAFTTSGDIRAWVFDDEAWNLYLDVSNAVDGWEDTLDAHGVTHLLLWERYHGTTLLPEVEASARWRKIAEDDFGAAFARVPGAAGVP